MDIINLRLPDRDRAAGVGFLRQFSVAETYPIHNHLDFLKYSSAFELCRRVAPKPQI